MTQDGLESKRERLEDLEKSEREARRLEEALGRGRVSSIHTPAPARTSTDGAESGEDDSSAVEINGEDPPLQEPYLPPHPGPNLARRKASTPGMGLLNALSYTLHGMMDVDPETARRNGISKTRETISSVSFSPTMNLTTLRYWSASISQLEEGINLSARDLKYANSTIQADLDRFQRQKVADMREMAISMARSHRDWCKKVGVHPEMTNWCCTSELNTLCRTWKLGKGPRRKSRKYPTIQTSYLLQTITYLQVLKLARLMVDAIQLPLWMAAEGEGAICSSPGQRQYLNRIHSRCLYLSYSIFAVVVCLHVFLVSSIYLKLHFQC